MAAGGATELERERRERHNLIVSRLEFAQIRVSKPGSSRLEHVCTRRASFICRVDLPTLLLNYRASSYIRFAARNLVGTLLSLSHSLSFLCHSPLTFLALAAKKLRYHNLISNNKDNRSLHFPIFTVAVKWITFFERDSTRN